MGNKLLSEQHRRNMMDGIVSWLNTNLDQFAFAPQKSYSVDPLSVKTDLSKKAFIELGLALRMARRSPALQQHPGIRDLENGWLDILSGSDLFFDINRRLQLFPFSVVALSVLRSLGRQNDEAHRRLQLLLQRGYIDRVERSAWEKVDMKYYIDAAGLAHQFPADELLCAASCLSNLPLLPYTSKHDLYGLTHLLFHLSDFGVRDMKPLLGDKYNYVQNYLDLSVAMCLVEQDWDLTAELLINQYCMRKTFTPADKDAACILYRSQQAEGFIPGRAWVKDKTASGSAQADFADVYHPTIVSMILLDCEYN